MSTEEQISTGDVHPLAQLRYLEDDFLTFWNEGPSSQTQLFWDAVQEAGLPYERVDRLGKIMTRGRISSRTEHDFAVDSIVIPSRTGASRLRTPPGWRT